MVRNVSNANMEYSIISLFRGYSEIKIPIIQRDYAQGRETAKEIRKNFLNAIKNNLDSGLHLDFIYGSVAEDKGERILILLDGQQRVTTLFLLYWYAAVKDGKKEEFREMFCFRNGDNIKSKLRYEIRPSSEDFLDYIVSDESIGFKEKHTPSEIIKDKNWFYLGWIHDPTVSGFLNMLDDINKIFADIPDLFEKLSNTPKITFEFLELNNFGLTDDLYIKMNSRGKLLTLYENFKAKIEKLIKKQYGDNKFLDIAKKFDGSYTDFFWEIANKQKGKHGDVAKLTDSYMYNFFYNLTLNLYALKNPNLLLSNYPKLDDFLKENSLISFYEEVYKDVTNLTGLIEFLDIITTRNVEEVIKPVLQNNPPLGDRIKFYAYYLGILYHKEDTHWYRILKNLINNTRIESIDDYIKSLKAIQDLSNKIQKSGKEILEYIEDKEKFIEFFSQSQQKEEMLKAKLILNDPAWEKEIRNVENNWYLDGKIGFLIEFSKQNDNYNLDTFKTYANKFILLWDFAKKSSDNQILLYRALLTKGDYLPEVGLNKTFCSFDVGIRSKIESWHRVFESDKKIYLKSLLDDLNSQGDIKAQLETIIKNHTVSDWRKYFIENSEYIKYCEKLQLRFEDDKIYLLKRKQMNSYHVELHSWHLYNRYFKPLQSKGTEDNICGPFKQFKYEDVNHTEYEPYIELYIGTCELKGEEYCLALKIEYLDKKFHFKVRYYDYNSNYWGNLDIPELNEIQCEENTIKTYGTFTIPENLNLDNFCEYFLRKISGSDGGDKYGQF